MSLTLRDVRRRPQ